MSKKVPQIRFNGYSDDWEERKLEEHAKYRRGSFPQPYGNKEWYDGEGAMPFVQVVDVTNKLTLVENTKQKISKLAQSKSVFVPKGTVVVTLQGSIGRVAITQYDSFVDRTLLIFEDYEKETDERFWAYTIQKKFEIEKLKAPGGTIKTITKEALSSFDVHLPQFKEQAKIGSFFKRLDYTIALHQRKLAKLKELKQGYLQKMFPKNGAKVPELRFAGFADDWEERKLGEHSNILTGGTPKTSMSNYWNPKEIPWMSSGEVNKRRINETDNMISKEGLENSSARWVKENSIVIALAGQGKTRGTVAVNNIPLTTNQSIAAIEPDETLNFEFIFQNLSKRYDELRMMSSGDGTRGGLNKKIIDEIIIAAPILEEQKKIGSFFKQLDNTITLHQRKLDLLKEQKKGFLQKMFV